MTTAVQQQHVEESFDIHEDLRTEDTEMMAEEDRTEEAAPMDDDERVHSFQQHQSQHMQHMHPHQQHQTSHHQSQNEPQEEEEEEPEEEESEEEAVDRTVQADMEKLQSDFPGFRNRYRLIKRIGEGMQALKVLLHLSQSILTNTYRNVLDCLQSRGYNVRPLRQQLGL